MPTLAHGVCAYVKLGGAHFRAFTMTWARVLRGTSCSAFARRKNLGLETVAGVAGGPEGGLRRVNWIPEPPLLRRFGTALRNFVRHLCHTVISPRQYQPSPWPAPRVFLLQDSFSKCFRRLL